MVDTNGEILGLVRGPDALLDAIDAVPQKARTTVFFSSPTAAAYLLANPDARVRAYVAAVRTFLGDPAALTGGTAFSLRAIGNLARPWFPDGELGQPPGPLSVPIEQFNIFSTGLQSRLIDQDSSTTSLHSRRQSPTDVPQSCTRIADDPAPAATASTTASPISPAACRSIAAACWSARSRRPATATTRAT